LALARGAAVPENKQDTDHSSSPTVRWRGGTICEGKEWDKRLSIFLLTYRASTHKVTGTVPTSMAFRGELHLPYDLLFRAALNKEQSVTDCMADLVDRLHDIHHYAHQHLKVASDWMKSHCDCLPDQFCKIPGR
jgi:hypothetical protein